MDITNNSSFIKSSAMPKTLENELDSYLQKYSEHFNENLPVFLMMGTSGTEIISTIQNCLYSGTPFVPKTIPNAYY